MKRRIVSLCLAVLLLLPMVLTGCGDEAQKPTKAYKENFDTSRISEGLNGSAADAEGKYLIDENNNFALYWSDGRQCALLHDKANNKWYSTAPYEVYRKDTQEMAASADYEQNFDLYSPLRIKYIETNETTNVSNVESADSYWDSVYYDANASTLLYNKEEKVVGVRLTYNFPSQEITVAIDLRLNENGLEVRVPLDAIREKKRPVYEIELVPYFVSAANDRGGYVMVPSGSGALIPAKNLSTGEETYSEPVYGADLTERVTMIKHSKNQIHLPVFGSSDNGKGMLGIIGNGAACARINAVTGDEDMGYTAAYASFRIRGEENVVLTSQDNNAQSSASTYTESIAGYQYLSVQYQPLHGDATYVDMANTYRQHLIGKGYLQKRPETVPALSVNFLGSTQVTESLFGIPYQADVATTTLAQTQNIASELKQLIGDKAMLLTLSGYGEGGLANTTIGGGFDLSGKVGDDDDMDGLLDFANKNNTILAMDYNLVYFQEGSSGFGTSSSAAYTNSHLKVEMYNYELNTGIEDEKGLMWYLLSRDKLSAAAAEATAAAKDLNLKAISFTSLSNLAYSDYRDPRNTAKAQMDKDVEAVLKNVGKDGMALVATKANQYAAVMSDYITDIPTRSSQYTLFSQEIPFYALVFQGYKALSTASINTAINVDRAFLDAVATGTALQFTLCDTFHDALQFEQDTAYISGRYADWKDDIAKYVEKYSDLHGKVGNQAITAHEQVNGLTKTTFENGVTVYVNYTDAAMATPMGNVAPMDFIYG